MPFDSQPPKRDIVAERMAQLSARVNEKPFPLPECFKGKLFSQRDLLEPAFAAIDAEVKAFEASRARLSPREDARSPDTSNTGKGAA